MILSRGNHFQSVNSSLKVLINGAQYFDLVPHFFNNFSMEVGVLWVSTPGGKKTELRPIVTN